jgi:hypothetical protein
MPGILEDLGGLQSLDVELGAAPSVVMWYEQWSSAPDFPASGASAVSATGAIPEISWEPWNPADGVDQPAYSLAAIASGAYDSYIRSWATEIKQWGLPLELRFAAEMNGNWDPWDEGVNGNGPGSYVAAWRHVHAIFTAVGVDNVVWVWSPNVAYDGSTPLAELFPGDAYVNVVALDGYNWGNVAADSTWQSFTQVFSSSLSQLGALTDLPIYLGEVGCTEDGGDKVSWIAAMFAQLADWPQVKGFTWFDWDKETDWRIDSSAASLAAFRAGIAVFSGENPVLGPLGATGPLAPITPSTPPPPPPTTPPPTVTSSPTVTSVNPTSGSTAGGTSVAITGTGFTGATAVHFGTTSATTFTVGSDTSITATSPAGTADTVNVTVTTPSATSATSAGDEFSYVTVPGAPTKVSAKAGNASATLTWTAPSSDGGAAINGYVIKPSHGAVVKVGDVTHDILTGLTNGTAYSFTVAAINAIGTGPSSAVSNSVTPAAATSKTALKLSSKKVTYGDEQAEHLSVTVSPQHSGPTVTGTVTVKASATTLCVIKLKSAKGLCRLSPKKLKAGSYHLVATYGGSANYKGLTSVKETVTVAK